ncbi:MAG: FecR domain-containing protein [Opitutaceae bacterium]|nr:FecR domain-containing protein [Opitutaceae bacterium]
MPSAGETPSPSDVPRNRAEAEAADWLIATDRGLTDAERRDFERWLAADARHAAAWAEAQQMWIRLDRADELPGAADAPVRGFAPAGRLRALAAAAAVAFVAFLGWRALQDESGRPARVVHLEPHVQTLADGTEVELNADAEIRTEFTPDLRRVRLVRGEAHFKVKKNPARPFEVDAGGVAVRALGTAFNVRLAGNRVGVLVTEGRVEVVAATGTAPVGMAPEAAAILEPRQQVSVPIAGGELPAVSTLTPADMEHSLAWLGLRLRFEDMPLVDVAAEFNRFSAARARPRLVVDESAARVLVAGTFRADNVDVFLRFLERGFGVKVEPRDDGTILLRQGP